MLYHKRPNDITFMVIIGVISLSHEESLRLLNSIDEGVPNIVGRFGRRFRLNILYLHSPTSVRSDKGETLKYLFFFFPGEL